MAGILDSINTLLSPLGTNFALKSMLERCLAARTKAEESEVVGRCLGLAEERLRQAGTSAGEAARCLALACFATTLGYDASFAAVHAVKMVQNNSLAAKRVGYLSCSVLVSERDPLALLLVNTVARDLVAGSALAVTLALAACTGAVSVALAPQLLPLITDKLAHPTAAVRARAVAVLHRHLESAPTTCPRVAVAAVVSLLGDDDPAVAAATLPFIATALRVFPNALDRVALADALAAFQRQVLQGRMPAQMCRHGISAPFAQAQAVRLLGECALPSNQVIQTIVDTLESSVKVVPTTTNHRATPSTNASFNADRGSEAEPSEAPPLSGPTPSDQEEELRRVLPSRAMVALECVHALAVLAPGSELLAMAGSKAGVLAGNCDVNVRCAALASLTSLRFSALAAQASLDAACTTERRLAVQLLATTASADTAKAACLRLTQHCHQHCANEPCAANELIDLGTRLIDQFPGEWSVPALVRLLALAPPKQAPALRMRLQQALAPSTTQDGSALDSLRRRVLRALSQHARLRTASTALLEAFVWSLARFPHLAEPEPAAGQSQSTANQSETSADVTNVAQQSVIVNYASRKDFGESEDGICSRSVSDRSESAPDEWDCECALRAQRRLADLGLRAVRGVAEDRLLVAVGDAAMRLVAAAGATEPTMQRLISELSALATRRGRLRDCSAELRACAIHASRLHKALAPPARSSAVDPTLSCADEFVCRILAEGGVTYRPRPLDVGQAHKGEEPEIDSMVTVEIIPVEPTAEQGEMEGDAWGTVTRTVWSPGGRVTMEPVPATEAAVELGEEDEASTSGDDFERLASDIAAMHR